MFHQLAPSHHVIAESVGYAVEIITRVVGVRRPTPAFLGVLQVPRTNHVGADTCSAARVAQEELREISRYLGVFSIGVAI